MFSRRTHAHVTVTKLQFIDRRRYIINRRFRRDARRNEVVMPCVTMLTRFMDFSLPGYFVPRAATATVRLALRSFTDIYLAHVSVDR